MKRSPMKRRYRATGPDRATRELVSDRDGHACIRCGEYTTQVHHRLPRGRGGDNRLSNLVLLCGSGTTGCHGEIEDRREDAYDVGLLVKTGQDPALVPVHVPFHMLGVVFLTDDGRYEPPPHVDGGDH